MVNPEDIFLGLVPLRASREGGEEKKKKNSKIHKILHISKVKVFRAPLLATNFPTCAFGAKTELDCVHVHRSFFGLPYLT